MPQIFGKSGGGTGAKYAAKRPAAERNACHKHQNQPLAHNAAECCARFDLIDQVRRDERDQHLDRHLADHGKQGENRRRLIFPDTLFK